MAENTNGQGSRLTSKLRRRGRENALLWIITWDHAAWSIAMVLAAVARLDFQLSVVEWSGLYGVIVFGVIALLVVGSLVGLYRRRHPVATHGEFRSLALTLTIVGLLTSFAYAPVMQMLGVTTPRSLGVLGAPIALFIMAGGRSLWRSADDRSRRPEAGRRTVVLGAGNAGQQIVRALRSWRRWLRTGSHEGEAPCVSTVAEWRRQKGPLTREISQFLQSCYGLAPFP